MPPESLVREQEDVHGETDASGVVQNEHGIPSTGQHGSVVLLVQRTWGQGGPVGQASSLILKIMFLEWGEPLGLARLCMRHFFSKVKLFPAKKWV